MNFINFDSDCFERILDKVVSTHFMLGGKIGTWLFFFLSPSSSPVSWTLKVGLDYSSRLLSFCLFLRICYFTGTTSSYERRWSCIATSLFFHLVNLS